MIELGAQTLKGAALDWAVAQVEGLQVDIVVPPVVDERNQPAVLLNKARWMSGHEPAQIYSPSTDWSQGGPLIDRFKVSVVGEDREHTRFLAMAFFDGATFDSCYKAHGSTPLEAVCRAIVRAKLGDVVQVPAKLVTA